MTFGLFPMPAWVAQNPIKLAGSAKGGDAISGVENGDLILCFSWAASATPTATPAGFASIYTGTVSTNKLALRVSKKTAASESGTWEAFSNDSTLYAWVRGSSASVTVGAVAGGTGGLFNMTSITLSDTGVTFGNLCGLEGYFDDTNVRFDSTDFAAWSPDITETYPTLSSGQTLPYTILRYKRNTPGSSGTPRFRGDSTNYIGGILVHVY